MSQVLFGSSFLCLRSGFPRSFVPGTAMSSSTTPKVKHLQQFDKGHVAETNVQHLLCKQWNLAVNMRRIIKVKETNCEVADSERTESAKQIESKTIRLFPHFFTSGHPADLMCRGPGPIVILNISII